MCDDLAQVAMSAEKIKTLAFRHPRLVITLILVALMLVLAADPVAAGDFSGSGELVDDGP